MDVKSLVIATVIGTILQLAMIAAGHYVPFVRDKVFMLGGLALSLVAGLIYAKMAPGGWGVSLGGGAIAGALCALIGIAASVALKDTPAPVLAFGTLTSALTGAIGAALGKLLS